MLIDSDSEVRRKMNVLDDQQVRQLIMEKVNAIPQDVQVRQA